MKNQPSTPPATAPGRKRMREMLHVSTVACRPPGAASPPTSPASRPSPALRVGASSHRVTSPPNREKLHHGKASLPWSPCAPGMRPVKIEAARDADRPSAGELRKLADQRPDRSTRRRDDHGFPGRGL